MHAVQSAHWYQADADGDSHQSSGSMVFMLRYPPEWWRHGGVHAEIPTRVVEAWYHAEIPTRVVEARCSCGDSDRSGPGMVFMPDDKQIWMETSTRMVQAWCSCRNSHQSGGGMVSCWDSHQSGGGTVFMRGFPPEWSRHGVHAWWQADLNGDFYQNGASMVFMLCCSLIPGFLSVLMHVIYAANPHQLWWRHSVHVVLLFKPWVAIPLPLCSLVISV